MALVQEVEERLASHVELTMGAVPTWPTFLMTAYAALRSSRKPCRRQLPSFGLREIGGV